MSLLWSAEVLVILDSNGKNWIVYALTFNFKEVLFLNVVLLGFFMV